MSPSLRIVFIALLLVVAGTALWLYRPWASQPATQPTAVASYQCDDGKAVTAAFYHGASKPATAPGEPPVPGGSVALTLSDGRAMTLSQTVSADGGRYSNGNPLIPGNETFVFWSKGNGALVFGNGAQKPPVDCITVAPMPAGSGLSQAFATSSLGFSIRYPQGYARDESYRYQELGPGKDIAGVKLTIPAALAAGTNLAADSYVSVEEIPQARDCSAALFLERGAAQDVVEGGTTYSVASTTGAGAGNRYEETVYAFPGTSPCIAVRYFIHYGVIENYPAGAVRAFDQQSLTDQFDAIRRTLTIR